MDIATRHKAAIFILIAATLLLGIQYLQPKESTAIVVQEHQQDTTQENTAETTENSISPPEITPKEIVIHVAGAVENPGVYVLHEGQRVDDAIQQAGIAENADANALNRAAILIDGQKIIVPSKEESHIINQQADAAPTVYNTIVQTETRNAKININTATVTQLMELPGIGEVKAGAIVRYRQEHGSFQTVEQLLQVNGIGNAIYSQIADLVCI